MSCSKTSWPDEGAARRALYAIWKAPPRAYTPSAIYHCRVCDHWHLTSKPIKPWSRSRNPKRGGR